MPWQQGRTQRGTPSHRGSPGPSIQTWGSITQPSGGVSGIDSRAHQASSGTVTTIGSGFFVLQPIYFPRHPVDATSVRWRSLGWTWPKPTRHADVGSQDTAPMHMHLFLFSTNSSVESKTRVRSSQTEIPAQFPMNYKFV